MNKLGFYLENTTVRFLRDALREVKPPVILVHAGDRGLLQDIRRELAPDAFVVGRMFAPLSEQERWLTTGDPEAHGRAFADNILNYDFGYATERGANGRLLVDAWMSLNEPIRGPASFRSGQLDGETAARAAALDRFQVAFRERLRTPGGGLEAVAFSFAAGNFTQPAHYLDWFPRTLESYTYLGFHEYGWPTLMPRDGTSTAALFYRRCMEGIRQKYGDRYRVIITELGLARMYKHASDPAGDVGWLYPGDTVAEAQYWESLNWYNDELAKDDYALGCCLFQVGHSGRWETFRHLGEDNGKRPITIISKIAALAKLPPDRPEPPSDREALRESLASSKAILTAIVQQTTRLLDLIGQLDKILTELAGRLSGTPEPKAVEALIQKVGTLDAMLDQAASQGRNPTDMASWRARANALKQQVAAIGPEVEQAAGVAAHVAQTHVSLNGLASRVQAISALKTQADALLVKAAELERQLGPAPAPATAAREIAFADVRGRLPVYETEPYPTRSVSDIRRIVVHHTGFTRDLSPEACGAAPQVRRGKPGTTYHFLVAQDGRIYSMQPLEAATEQTTLHSANADAVAVALSGDFREAVPSPAQMDAAADLIAWLLRRLGLGIEAVYGRCELDDGIASPGAQWLQGSQYKITLLAAVARQL